MNWTLVTGAAKGLGSAICLELAKRGHNLVVQYRESKQDAEAVRDECRKLGANAEIIQGDLAVTEAFIQEYASRFPKTKNLVNNVGNYYIGSFLNTPVELWKDLYQTNFFAPVQLMQALVPSIMELKGAIVNIGATGLQSADTYSTAYTSSKLALWMATKSLAKEKPAIRVNMVSPGYLENAVDLPSNLSVLPQGKPVTLEETARLVAFLLDDNQSITGQNIEIAGAVRL